MANSHLSKVIASFIRPDGGTVQWGYFNEDTGTFMASEPHQGYADGTTWSRGHDVAAVWRRQRVCGDRPRRVPRGGEEARELLDRADRQRHGAEVGLRRPGVGRAFKDSSAAAVATSALLSSAAVSAGTPDGIRTGPPPCRRCGRSRQRTTSTGAQGRGLLQARREVGGEGEHGQFADLRGLLFPGSDQPVQRVSDCDSLPLPSWERAGVRGNGAASRGAANEMNFQFRRAPSSPTPGEGENLISTPRSAGTALRPTGTRRTRSARARWRRASASRSSCLRRAASPRRRPWLRRGCGAARRGS